MSKFIVIEGTDASGKSTQLNLICAALEQKGVRFTRLTFPRYQDESSALLKMYLRGDFGTDPEAVNPYAASVFFSVDRYASFKTDWQAAYDNNEIIISDRYTTSNAIHQASKLEGEKRDEYLNWLFDFEYNLLGLPKPDCVLFLDMPSEFSFKLLSKRQGNTGDIHELDHEYLEKCRVNAIDVMEKYGWTRIGCVEAGEIKSPQRINDEIFLEIGEVLGIE